MTTKRTLADYKDTLKDKAGRYRSSSLFKECYESTEEYPALFTLSAEDKGELISFGRVFIELEDPTGYETSQVLLGSYQHWKKLLKAKWFREALEGWEEELEIKLKSKAVQQINKIAETDTSQALQASKYLADKGWEKKRGAPTKAEKAAAAKKAAKVDKAVSDDLARVGLSLVK